MMVVLQRFVLGFLAIGDALPDLEYDAGSGDQAKDDAVDNIPEEGSLVLVNSEEDGDDGEEDNGASEPRMEPLPENANSRLLLGALLPVGTEQAT